MLFRKFTQRMQSVLDKAKQESIYFKHGYIGTEHILLGLLSEKGFSKNVLEKQGITYEKIKNLIDNIIGVGEVKFMLDPNEYILTPRTNKILENALTITEGECEEYITPEHVLISLLQEEEGVAYTLLTTCKVERKLIVDEINEFIKNNYEAGKEELPDFIDNSFENNKDTPILNKYSKDLTELARESKLDPVIGREDETERMLEILCRRIKNNPCLIGEPGVGKTSVVEGLAQKINSGDVPEILRNKRIVSLDLSSIIAGAKYRGEFEERLKKIMDETINRDNIIIFIDEIHTIVGAGGAEGAIDAANILKPALARGEIRCIGATTISEYRKYIEKDVALERRFQPIHVGEPSDEQTLNILKGLRDKYEEYHKVKITDKALEESIRLSKRYIRDRYMPDKAIDIIDEASAKIRINSKYMPKELDSLEKSLKNIIEQKEIAIKNQKYEEAAKLRDEEKRIEKEIKDFRSNWEIENIKVVDEEVIAEVVSSWTKIPISKLTEKEAEKLVNLESILYKKVIGQEEAVKSIATAVRRARVGLKDPNRPIGSFIFCGPTGVGKTELSNTLAEVLFDDRRNLIRIDMSEYMEKHSVSRLIGSPPGYAGYDEGGQLTESVRKNPYSVVLLDEIEKAHPDVLNILLQIMDDGRLTDGKGKVVDFRNTILIMTSNIGAHNMDKKKILGFNIEKSSNEDEYNDMKNFIMKEIKNSLSPEFINRVDDIIIFHKLREDDYIKILDIMLQSTQKRLKEKNILLDFNKDSKKYLINIGIDNNFGARPLRRIIVKELEDKLSDEMLRGQVKPGDSLEVMSSKEGLIFKHK